MTRQARPILFAITLSVIMLVSMVAPVAGGAVAASENPAASISSDQPGVTFQQSDATINVTDDLSVWERAAARPAIVDRSGAATTVETPTSFLYDNTGETIKVSTQQEAVFETGDTVSFELEQKSGATTSQFAGQQFRVLVVEFDGNRDTVETFLDAQDINVSDVEDSFEDVDGYDAFMDEVDNREQVSFSLVRDFFEGTDQFEQFAESFAEDQEITVDRLFETLTSDEFLELVSFETANAGSISSSGSATATVTLDEPGSYLLLGHVGGDVYDTGDERPFFNDTTVIAADAVTAQEAAADISVQTSNGEVELGENVTVTANANLGGSNISHATMVFDENTLSDQTLSLNATADISRDLRTEDLIVRSSIATVQGVANVQPNTQVSGTTLADERFSGRINLTEQSTSFFDARNALVDGFDIRDQAGGPAEFTTIGDTTLNASVTAVGDQTATTTINVETLDTWTSGEYTVLHIATDQDTGHISTARESISLVDDVSQTTINDLSVNNVRLNTTSINTGDAVRVRGTIRNNGPSAATVGISPIVNGSAPRQITRTIDAGQSRRVSFNVRLNSAGTFRLGLRARLDGQTIRRNAANTVTVTTPSRGGGGGGGGGFGGGGGAPPSGGGDTVEPPAPPENVEVTNEENAELGFNETSGRSTASFTQQSNVESVSFGFDAAGSVNVRDLDAEPDETGPMPGGSVSVSQITVSDFLENSAATIQMRVSKDRLSELDAAAEDLRINRYNDDAGQWQGLETEVVGETNTHVRLEAETPGFSFFGVSAVSEPEAVIESPSEIEVGDELTLDGSGSSDQYGEIVAYDWTVGDTTLSGETVTTAFEEPTDVTVELTVENDAGETNTATATVTVTEAAGPGDGTDGTDGTDGDDEPEDSPSPVIAVVLLLFALLIGGGVAYYIITQDEP